MAEEKKTTPAPEEQKPEPPAPEAPPAPAQTEQAVIPGMEGPPAKENKVIDLSSVRPGAGQEKEGGHQEEPEKPRRGRRPKAKEAPAQGEKPKRKGRPPKSEKQAPGGGGAGRPARAPKQDKAAGPPAPAKEEAPPPPASEQPPQPRDASRAEKEEIVYLDLSQLHPFQNHPFGVRDDVEMEGLVSSVKAGGVHQPALVRPREGGGYVLRLAGTAYGQIAAALNREGIPSPRVYWSRVNGKDSCKAAQLWSYATVKDILRNPVYKGMLVMNHTGTRSYKDHTQISKPETEWICHEALHEAIISPEDWDAVQKINEAASLRSVGRQDPAPKLFTGKLICADCKAPMSANAETQHRRNGTKKRYVSYFCGTYGRSGRSVCSWHRIYELTLAEIVTAEIKAHAQAVTVDEAAVVDRLKRKVADYDEHRLSAVRQEIGKLRRRVQELEAITAKLYEDKYSGAVSESTFMMLTQKNEQERLAKAERLEALLSEVDKAEKETAAIHNWTAIIRKYLDLQELDRATIDELIDHIEIGERTIVDGQRRQDIKVFYRFVGLVE